MKALIFAAGLGTRLKPITDTMPKALVPVGGKPLIEHVARKLKASGVDSAVVNVHHFADQIEEWIGVDASNPRGTGLSMQVSDERDQLLETGGGILKAEEYLHGCGNFLVHNVDILSNLDIKGFASKVQADALATLLVSERETQRYLLFDPQTMRLVGWTNVKTGEVKSPFQDIQPDSCVKMAFSGIHMISDKVFDIMQEYVKEKPLNNYKIIAAAFCASNNLVYAIPFTQEGEELFYNIDGNSLEGAFLKAPLDFYRITSRFSNSRMHPVLKRRRAHHGVDYAAPVGTPVYAIGNGKVIDKGYQAKGGGNYVKIRHNSTYTTTYMHLSKFAKGLKVGSRVSQGQVIGYVGSTGYSTGPHLDFRLWKGGTPINPLNVPQKPSEPISKENREKFEVVKSRVIAELEGEVPDSMKVTNLEMVK